MNNQKLSLEEMSYVNGGNIGFGEIAGIALTSTVLSSALNYDKVSICTGIIAAATYAIASYNNENKEVILGDNKAIRVFTGAGQGAVRGIEFAVAGKLIGKAILSKAITLAI